MTIEIRKHSRKRLFSIRFAYIGLEEGKGRGRLVMALLAKEGGRVIRVTWKKPTAIRLLNFERLKGNESSQSFEYMKLDRWGKKMPWSFRVVEGVKSKC